MLKCAPQAGGDLYLFLGIRRTTHKKVVLILFCGLNFGRMSKGRDLTGREGRGWGAEGRGQQHGRHGAGAGHFGTHDVRRADREGDGSAASRRRELETSWCTDAHMLEYVHDAAQVAVELELTAKDNQR